ncbi:oxygen-insensitive NADPH nitroreductase [Paenibacillus aurantius]|uniref:Oxygen-insensitive NADPH nitroreductase n=1 Tax=Paenibacillus aurantius TaxID=2918900 RepID=A0AA96RFW7_9BACL|nr:oxygen-insensitive NADPH nitroreductase [Paenibacillus aurantius]WNQ11921.1 oxygen-insensitive NADPH nitroreductase [Paenibacillus aurantius]
MSETTRDQANQDLSNETIRTLIAHRSIRRYKPDPVEPAKRDAILYAAQMASTSSNMQAYSVIGVTEPALKRELAVLTGNQAYVEQCPLFLVWCADLYRLKEAGAKHGTAIAEDTTENFIIATVDAALAAQNAASAAESLGLGIVYIGGIRNRIAEVTGLLKLPKLVYPVFGMCLGYPDQDPGLRPRLPVSGIYHENAYRPEQIRPAIDEYDRIVSDYMRVRTGGQSDRDWSSQMAERLSVPQRAHMRAYLEEQGFKLT